MEVEEREKQREAGNAPLPAAAPAGRRACRQLRHARRRACRLFAGGLVMELGDELGKGDGLLEPFMVMKPAAGQERLIISSEWR
jgi:hypothetical protein